MARRLTDTEKWNDPWFFELPGEMKLLWLFMLDTCDHAGIWKLQLSRFNSQTGFHIMHSDLVKFFGDRLYEINQHTFVIPKFIKFQYPTFNPEKNKAHLGVVRGLSYYNVSFDALIYMLDFPGKESSTIGPCKPLARGTGIGTGTGVGIGIGIGIGTGEDERCKKDSMEGPGFFDSASIPDLVNK